MRLPDWTQQDWKDELGSATVDPNGDAVAGESGTWRIAFRVGRWGIDERGSIKLAFRQVSDWGEIQFDDPKAANYTTVHLSTRSGARLVHRFDWRGYIRHWRQALTIDVLDDPLWEGDTITIVLGDMSAGGPGMEVQTFGESNFEFKIFVDPFGAGNFQPLPESPKFSIVGGPAERLVALIPSEAAANEKGWLLIKAEDRHGNPAEGYAEEVRIEAEGAKVQLPEKVQFDGKGTAVLRTEEIRFDGEGVARVRVRDGKGREALSNPVVIRSQIEDPRLHWGDFHGGQTGGTVGVGSFEEFYRFARDVGALEFTTHQGNCFEVTLDDMEELKEKTRAFNEPGRFVTFLGYEWSGTPPMGGDHALFFFDEAAALHRCSHWLQTDLSDISNDRDHITKIHETLRGTRAISYPHVGGRPANLEFHDPELEPIIEVHSKHGMFEWMIEESIDRVLKVGFAGGSDDHYGHPGACYPGPHVGHFASRNGLTALYTEELTRESIWNSAKARRCYATSGDRIYLRFAVNGCWMGEEIEANGPPRLTVEVHGTGPIERVEIFRGRERIYSEEVSGRAEGNLLRVLFSGARVRGRGRATKWDGELRLTGARLLRAEPVAFIPNRDRINVISESGLSWGLYTAGDSRGFVIEPDGSEGDIAITTEPAAFSCRVEEALSQTQLVDAGRLAQRIEIGRTPASSGPWETRFEFEDTNAQIGLNTYWVRVVQVDQEKAWSSPVWVNLK